MTDVEDEYPTKSGFLCSEVGMGKTAVVIGLIATNPMALEDQPSVEELKEARFLETGKQIHVKSTIIFTSKSLLGQWEDEIQRHAPNLSVGRNHGKSKLRAVDLAELDVIISCPTVEWSSYFRTKFKYHRIVLDESHLLGTISARPVVVNELLTDRIWCVTATPMVSSYQDLEQQVNFLELDDELNELSQKQFIERYMLRHTKAMLINGSTALTLPESTTTVKRIAMTEWERETFEEGLEDYRSQSILNYHNALLKMVQMRWYSKLMIPLTCEDSSKVEQLKADLAQLLEKEPNMRVVVFTQFREQLKYTRKALQAMGLKTFTFDGSKSAEYRDKYIREFQQTGGEEGAAVFLTTMQTGNVGITLTAASHVLLMELCIDPAQEVQAGRVDVYWFVAEHGKQWAWSEGWSRV